ncbi:MAG: YlcI/YnfO family protein [Eggerthellaceae bacterium]
MGYVDLIKNNASATDIQAYLVDGEQTAITIRIPKNLRDSVKDAAVLRGTTLSALVRECLIKELSKETVRHD